MKNSLPALAAITTGLALAVGGMAPASATTSPTTPPPCVEKVNDRCVIRYAFPAAVPATLAADGSLPFLGWASPNVNAQADRGYRSPDGTHDIYLDRVYDGPGTYTATVYRRGGFDLRGADGSRLSGAQQRYTVEPRLTITPEAPTLVDLPGEADDTVVFPASDHGTYKFSSVTPLPDGTTRFRVAFTPDEGLLLSSEGSWDRVVDGKPVWFFFADRGPLAPEAPQLVDEPGTARDRVVFPTSDRGTYKISSVTPLADGTTRFRVAFTPHAGNRLATEGSWDRVVDGKPVWFFFASQS